MPSFRVTMTIGALAPGVAPPSVQPMAASAAAELATVEASNVAVVRGAARLTVRFTAEDSELAEQVAGHVVAITSTIAEATDWTVTQRIRDRWVTIARA